jgi:radical SAM protein with 4Fe4S-binding SPASM domain
VIDALRRRLRPTAPAWIRSSSVPAGPLWVDLGPAQPHPIDLRWVDEMMASARPHLRVRPEDELLILVPNTPVKVNPTALRILGAMVDEELGIAEVLGREGDGPRRRREIHAFFTDLSAWLRGTLGEGVGRRAVVHEPFTAEFCRYPVLSEIALTYRCTLSCTFCYAGCGVGALPEGWSEDRVMSDDEVCRVLEIIHRDARCPSVSFTGGEPTLRPGLPRLVRHAKTLGLKVNLISNGQHLDERRARALADAGLDSAQLSLEGPTAEIHDAQVQRDGAFERLWAAAGRLRVRGVRVHTNTTLTRHNLVHAPAVVDLVADRGLARLTMNLVIPCGTAGSAPDLGVPYTEIGAHVLGLRERAAARGVELIWYSPLPLCLFNTVAHGLGNRGCAAADGLLHVSPAGDVLPCSSFSHGESLGNLLREPFEAIWRSRAACFFRAKEMMPPGCRGCGDAAVCQGACVLYWREVGLGELGGAPGSRPPLPAGFGGEGGPGSRPAG